MGRWVINFYPQEFCAFCVCVALFVHIHNQVIFHISPPQDYSQSSGSDDEEDAGVSQAANRGELRHFVFAFGPLQLNLLPYHRVNR